MTRRRYALVGTGGRAKMYVDAITRNYRDHADLVALCDISQVRMQAYERLLTEQYGLPPVPLYPAADFDRMLAETRPDTVIVTSMDSTHHLYINRALRLGCDVITEKPMTTHVDKAQSILESIAATGRRLTVTFNYRYMPLATRIRQLILEGVIGRPLKVDFMWTLDVRHGADYFRRWHREKEHSGGLLVHKATHHFDLVNWWIDSLPQVVFALGERRFYGRDNAAARGEQYPYERYTGEAAARHDPFALRLDEHPDLTALYLAAEAETGYVRDRNVFGENITAEDTMGVLVRYRNGVQMTYSLVAYCPWEGFRLAITGTQGRLEADEIEGGTTFIAGPEEVQRLQPINEQVSMQRLRVFPMWAAPYEVPVTQAAGGHGGGDEALLRDLFLPQPPPDPFGRAAGHLAGTASILVGLAANRSIETGQPVQVDDLIRLP
ncbi:MAG: Gfo/Idh/MocA family oxidoreductase [Anaerolineae bacterium]|nr:Gfo/Idh/MocA family oxidoreductase [Anaerolineae bacterium]